MRKLIRDRIPEIARESGQEMPVRPAASIAELRSLLAEKIVEEATEVKAAQTRSELIAELADLDEVREELMHVHGVMSWEVRKERRRKLRERGNFSKGLVWDDQRPL